MNFVLSKEQLEALAKYFAGRPWAEANGYMVMLDQLPRLEAKAVSSEEPKAEKEAK